MVNSPVEVTVNGKDAEVINTIGWPGTYDLYRVDFRVPAGLPLGKATVHLTTAWIPGPPVEFAVQYDRGVRQPNSQHSITGGISSVSISAAWIPGPEFKIPVRPGQ